MACVEDESRRIEASQAYRCSTPWCADQNVCRAGYHGCDVRTLHRHDDKPAAKPSVSDTLVGVFEKFQKAGMDDRTTALLLGKLTDALLDGSAQH